MADHSLSNSSDYTIRLTADEYKKHQYLLYIGSIMSQLLRENYFCETRKQRLSYSEALHEIKQSLDHNRRYAVLWDELALEMYKIYER
jgi:hypothetical protein